MPLGGSDASSVSRGSPARILHRNYALCIIMLLIGEAKSQEIVLKVQLIEAFAGAVRRVL